MTARQAPRRCAVRLPRPAGSRRCRATHTLPSGMGGSFDVAIVEEMPEGRVRIVVVSPRNPDWDEVTCVVARHLLRPLARNSAR